MSRFPERRLRRLRQNNAFRRLFRETHLCSDDMILPIFVAEGEKVKHEISSMPGVFRFSVDMLVKEIEDVTRLGLQGIILFGIPDHKDEWGTQAYHAQGIIQRAVQSIKKVSANLLVITDVCLCEYTNHGHCGVVIDGQIDNDETLKLLAKTALSHAVAGADMVAPSDMMDGRVKAIRTELDKEGYHNIPILSYAAKYASAFYGPFRDAADSAPKFGDRYSHQMDPPNSREALREIEQDIAEGADVIMVKPALAYLDVIRMARSSFNVPLAAYNVSGEYAMVKAAARNGWVDEKRVVLEILTAIKRAGADIIITYHAKEAVEWLKETS